jgi:hypothetical protein
LATISSCITDRLRLDFAATIAVEDVDREERGSCSDDGDYEKSEDAKTVALRRRHVGWECHRWLLSLVKSFAMHNIQRSIINVCRGKPELSRGALP